jgi:hypothetical protein
VTFANPFPTFNKGKSPSQEKASICKYTEMCNAADIAFNKERAEQEGKPFDGAGDISPTLVGYEALAKLVNGAYLANPAR